MLHKAVGGLTIVAACVGVSIVAVAAMFPVVGRISGSCGGFHGRGDGKRIGGGISNNY